MRRFNGATRILGNVQPNNLFVSYQGGINNNGVLVALALQFAIYAAALKPFAMDELTTVVRNLLRAPSKQ